MYMSKQFVENSLKKLKLEIPCVNKKNKICNKNFRIPIFKEFYMLIENDYNVPQLKMICGEYGMLKAGKKDELITKIYRYLYFSNSINKIQKIYRKYLIKVYNKYHGPAYKNNKLCVNDTDFVTQEDLDKIPDSQFFSFKDVDGMIYGFNVSSLYEYIFNNNNTLNPYTRGIIPKNTITNIRTLIKLSHILNINMEIKIKQDILSPKKSFELRTISLFNKIDELGNYTDYNWFYILDKPGLIRYIRELHDIWSYRLQLSDDAKRNICPRGEPFRTVNLYNILNHEVLLLKRIILTVMEEMVNSSTILEHQSLGAIYVLTALTLVSADAATAMPWLYHSVVPI